MRWPRRRAWVISCRHVIGDDQYITSAFDTQLIFTFQVSVYSQRLTTEFTSLRKTPQSKTWITPVRWLREYSPVIQVGVLEAEVGKSSRLESAQERCVRNWFKCYAPFWIVAHSLLENRYMFQQHDSVLVYSHRYTYLAREFSLKVEAKPFFNRNTLELKTCCRVFVLKAQVYGHIS